MPPPHADLAFAANAHPVRASRDPLHARLARVNATDRGLAEDAEVRIAEAADADVRRVLALHADARRALAVDVVAAARALVSHAAVGRLAVDGRLPRPAADAQLAGHQAVRADAALLLAPGQREALAEGRAALRRAVELDETLAEPHAALGMLASNFDHDWAEAEREYKRAIELSPNYATARHRYGEFLAMMGRFDEGLAELRRAQELDPLSLIISTDVGSVYYLARQYDRNVRRRSKWTRITTWRTCGSASAYSAKGQHEAAIAEFHRVEGFADDGIFLSWLGYVYGAAGRRAEAQRVLKRLTVFSKKTYVPPSSVTVIHAGLGEKDEAFKWAERMFEEQDSGVPSLKVHPLFDSLRSDPRYADLLRRAKFT